ncbi:MAG: hypothetical protein JSW61_04485 [Candidatus Thorarchaeota archaeon]|nr:MAG: hypothetical protein JSW61_04485 [Candidatus Thorarchaeota archaeon]
MGSPWFSKKAFLYFGGAAVILIGGAIILNAPYHAFGYIATTGDEYAFEMWESAGFYDQIEIVMAARPSNDTTIYIDLRIVDNDTLEERIFNITLNSADRLEDVQPMTYEERTIIELGYGNYTINLDRVDGITWIDVAYTQLSDSRTFIVVGGAMNILGLIMGAAGYCVSGTLITSEEETIVEWGYDDRMRPR